MSLSVSPIDDYLRDPLRAIRAVIDPLTDWIMEWRSITGPAIALAFVAIVGCRARWLQRRHDRLIADARVITVLPPPTVDPAGAVTLWSNLVGMLRPAWKRWWFGQPHLAFELVFDHDGVRIRLWVPGPTPPGMVERAIEAAWPGAHTRTTPARPPLELRADGRGLIEAGGELCLGRAEALPIRTTFDADPIRALLGAPVGLGLRERACVQVLARPVAGRRITRAKRAGLQLHTASSPHLLGKLLDILTPHTGRKPSQTASLPRQTSLEFSTQDRAVVTKQRGSQYETRIRYAVATTLDATATPADIATARDSVRGRAHAIASAFAAYTEHNYYRRSRLRHPVAALADRRLRRGDLLSVAELASIAHLPTDDTVPGLQRAGARAVSPPPGIATAGELVKPLGITDSGHSRPVGLKVSDARHHTHILGATGSGKSELVARMILADANAGRGLVVIDPKGDLISDILMRLPENLGPKVVLFDADSRSRPPVINPLEGSDQARTVDNLVSIFSRVYASAWGPRTDDILRAGLLTLTAQPGVPTLTDLPKLLTVPAFRQRATSHVADEVLKGFWSWYEDLSDASRAHVIAPLMNKVRGFLLRPFVRAAIAGGPSTVDMDHVLNGGICLVRIAKDALGMETARLVGSIVVARTWQAATRRASIPQRERRDAALYIDECHNFLNLPYALEDMLAEARGYRLAMTLAHQYLAQLPRELEEGISANARSKIIFNASPEDARRLARHTQPRLVEHDLSNLGAFHIAARLVLDGEETAPFTAVTEKLPPAIPGRAPAIRKAARINTQPPEAEISHPPVSATADPRRSN